MQYEVIPQYDERSSFIVISGGRRDVERNACMENGIGVEVGVGVEGWVERQEAVPALATDIVPVGK